MNRARLVQLTLLLMLAPLATALAECPVTPAGFHTYVGVDVTTPETIFGNELDRSLDLLRLQIVWLPKDPDRRYRDKNVIDIDWVNRSHSNVDVFDGQLQAIRARDIHPVDLASNTNFETGQLHLITCDHAFRGHPGAVLVFAYYGVNGRILQDQTRVSTLTAQPVFGAQTAVINNTVSGIISGIFNDGLDQRVLDDVALSTGVRPDDFLAQSILFQNLEPTQELLKLNPVSFFSPINAKVLLNRVYITGDNA